jgi:hypothetical protein
LAQLLESSDPGAPTGCRGWTAGDLWFHLFLDAQRALIALATPAGSPPDRDYVTYWREWSSSDPDAVEHANFVRRVSTAMGGREAGRWWRGTSQAVLRAAAAAPAGAVLATQGHRLRLPDLLGTLAVEATVHHLDLLVGTEGPGPAPLALTISRRTLDGLLGAPCPLGWDDRTYLKKGTGREELTAEERSRLGRLEDLIPLFS